MTRTSPPWKRGWLFIAPGETPVFLWIHLIHILALGGAIYLILRPAPWAHLFSIAFGIGFLGALGLTVQYHRALAHRALQIHPAVEQLLIFITIFNGFGTPLNWVANHRRHHRASDTLDDVSSPLHGGFWWSHLRWLWQAGQNPAKEYCPELEGLFRYRIWNPLLGPILIFSLFFPLIWGWHAWIWIGPIRLVYFLNAVCCINSICHMSARPQGVDHSQNLAWLTPFMFGLGENWHRNHHNKPLSAKLGFRRREIDLGWTFIACLQKLGLATQVRFAKRPQSL